MARAALYDALEGGAITRRERYEQLDSALWSDRTSFDSHWQELGDWLVPTRTRFFTTQRANAGGKRNQNIIDSTARFAARTLSSGMHAGLTSPARPWFKLGTPDPDLAKYKPVAEWLETVTQRMMVIFGDSNLYLAFPTLYLDQGVFGTAAMGMLPDAEELFRCYNYPIGSYALGLDERGKVGIFSRRYEMTVLQAVREFGLQPGMNEIDWSRFSTTVRTLFERGNYTAPIEILWLVQPNERYRPGALGPRGFRFSSCHIERGSTERAAGFLREGGFDTFPIFAPRWDITGAEDAYGTDCPGMTALGDVKQLQIQHKDKGKAIRKKVDPPLQAPPELRSQKVSQIPGDITFVRDTREGGVRALHEVQLEIGDLVQDMSETRYRIQRAFFEDLFLMMARGDGMGAERPTAREVDERHEEKLIVLGPVVERNGDEVHDPLIDRAFGMMQANRLVPPAPPELEGVKLQVEYVSVMAQAQKLAGVVQQDRFLTSSVQLAASYPEARHKIVVFRAVDNYAAMYGVDPRMVRSDEEAQQLADAEKQAAQQQMQAEAAAKMGAAVKAAGTTPMGTDSALDRLSATAAASAGAQ